MGFKKSRILILIKNIQLIFIALNGNIGLTIMYKVAFRIYTFLMVLYINTCKL